MSEVVNVIGQVLPIAGTVSALWAWRLMRNPPNGKWTSAHALRVSRPLFVGGALAFVPVGMEDSIWTLLTCGLPGVALHVAGMRFQAGARRLAAKARHIAEIEVASPPIFLSSPDGLTGTGDVMSSLRAAGVGPIHTTEPVSRPEASVVMRSQPDV